MEQNVELTKKFVYFLYDGLKSFYPNLIFPKQKGHYAFAETWKGWERTEFDLYLLNVTKTDDIEIAKDLVLIWKEKVDKGEISSDMPSQDILEKDVELQEKTEKATPERTEAKKELLQESQKRVERNQQETLKEKPEEKTTSEAKTEVKKEIPQKQPAYSKKDIGILFEGTPKPPSFNIGEFIEANKIMAGISNPETNSVDATAAYLMTQGVSPTILRESVEKSDLSSEQKEKFDGLIKTMEALNEESPVLRELAQRKIFSKITIADIPALEKLGVTQGKIMALLTNETTIAGKVYATYAAPKTFLKAFTNRVVAQVFGSVGRRGIERMATRGAIKLFGKAGGKAAAALAEKGAIGAVAGGAAEILSGPAGWILLAAQIVFEAVKALSKKLTANLKAWFAENKEYVAAALLTGGIILHSAFMILPGAGIFAFGGFGKLLPKSRSFFGRFKRAFRRATRHMFFAFIRTILITSIGVTIFIAIVMFIINSGAYITPPSDFQFSESPYINVTKTATPSGPFGNSDIPVSVDYTIEISALKGSLVDIQIDYKCEAIKENGKANCPPVQIYDEGENRVYPGPQQGLVISPSKSYVLHYSAEYSSGIYEDSAIIDTITVTANTSDEKGAKSSGSASVIIGNPPTQCFTFDGDWPGEAKSRELTAIAEMSSAATYMTTLCSGGEILLRYGGNNGNVGGDVIAGNNIITIYKAGVNYGSTSTLYTLSHETGHIYARRNGSIYQKYTDTGGVGGNYICSYPFGKSDGESFPEMIALYFSNSPGHAPISLFSCLGGSFKSKYPNHWNFARQNIFFEDLGW